MAADFCSNCNAHVCDQGANAALMVRFPHDVLHCYTALANGPGSAMCPNCSHINTFDFLSIIVKNGAAAIIGVPEGKSELEETAVRARDMLLSSAPELEVTVTTTNRDFKRAFLAAFVTPAVVLLNEFSVSKRDLKWMQGREDHFDYAFFTALWLTLTGVVQVFTRQADEYDGAPFVPHEQAPDDARNLVAKREALRNNAETAGAMLGTLLISMAASLPPDGSVAALTARLAVLMPGVFLEDEVLAAAAETIGDMSELLHQDAAALPFQYMLELVMAMLCHTYHKTNPRRAEWTEIAFLYEFLLREAGVEAAYVPEPDVMRATLDEQRYWQVMAAFVKRRGLNQLGPTSQDALARLAETVVRIYPDELQARMRLGIKPVAGTTSAQFLATCKKSIDTALNPINVNLVGLYLHSLYDQAPDVLPDAARFVRQRMAQLPETALAARCYMLCVLIEYLNKSGHAGDAYDISTDLEALIEDPALAQTEPVACAVALNELGNCRRMAEQYREALALYDHSLALLDVGADDPRARVAMRNRAIVLRELHFYTEAMQVCNALLPYATSTEKRGIIVTQATCLLEMGQSVAASKLLEPQAGELDTVGFEAENVLSVIALLGFLRLQAGRVSEARALLLPAVATATKLKFYSLLLVADLSSLHPDSQQDVPLQDAAIDSLHATLIRVGGGSLDWLVMSVIVSLDHVMTVRGQAERAEQLIRELVERADFELSPRCWQLSLLAAAHAECRGDLARRRADVLAAMLGFQLGLANAAAADDIASYSSPQGQATAHMVTEALDLFSRDECESFALLLAADLRATPVLTSRLRRLVQLPPPLADSQAEHDRLQRLLQATPAVVLQFVGDGQQLSLVCTALDQHGRLQSRVERLPVGQPMVEKAAKSLSFALKTSQTAVRGQGSAHVTGWQELASVLAGLTADLPEGTPLVVVAGPVGEAAISLSIGHRHPVCFVSSVGALISLRERRLASGELDAWRPSRLFTFAAWFDREKPAQVEALAAVAESGAALASAFGLESEHASGKEASGPRLMAGLERADLAWLACHGRILSGAESVDLYVAAGGNLPAADLNQLNESNRSAHLVNWQALAGLAAAPRVVVSSACDSGLTTTNPGGERLGLERPLFGAGAIVLAAPLWPVPTREIQQQVGSIMQHWLAEPDTSFALQAWRARRASIAAGMTALAADAVAVFGDAL
jgi:tetratricopeptide (TPR) repeat protein